MSRPTIVFCGGGSGGHLSPAIAIMQQLQRLLPDFTAVVFCSDRPVDRRMLELAASRIPELAWHPLVSIPRGPFPKRQLQGLFEILRVRQWLIRRFRQQQPAVVVGLGAFASIPGILAARRLAIPTVLLEANTIPGRATRQLASLADCLFTGLPLADSMQAKLRIRMEHSGVPVRSEVAGIARESLPPGGSRRTLLVIGGSQGAANLNSLVQQAFGDGCLLPGDWRILHQTGVADRAALTDFYLKSRLPADVVEFLPDLPRLLREAGLAVSRAGAVSLAELACAGVPSILIPLSTAADGHQRGNAEYLASTGAAVVVDETAGTAAGAMQLGRQIREISHSESRLTQMAIAARDAARPDAAKIIAEFLQRIVSPSAVATPRGTSS
ncbi:MAG: UDP-N-acetylglucosamine--N-acetylmuramyl-(pentapeptide) pyrophosphoryl-undecaprenol N-acetylglucosamine transferase [Planctomycetota bacterium]